MQNANWDNEKKFKVLSAGSMPDSDLGEIFEQGRRGDGDGIPAVNKAISFLKYVATEGKPERKSKVGQILLLLGSGPRVNLITYSAVSAQTSGTLLSNLEEPFQTPKSVFRDLNK